MTTLSALLSAQALTEEEAEFWTNLICVSTALFRRAYQRMVAPIEWAEFLENVALSKNTKKHAAKGKIAISAAVVTPTEPDLSSRLYQIIILIQADETAGSSINALHVDYEPPIAWKGRSGIRSRKPDFRVRLTSRRWLAIEAKLLGKVGDVKSSYLGIDGIQCFTTADSPYTLEPVAMMLAYVLTQDEPAWQNCIEAELAAASSIVSSSGKVTPSTANEPSLHSKSPRPALTLPEILVLHCIMKF